MMFYLLIGSNLIMGLIFFARFNTLPPQIPLFFTKVAGEEQLADIWMIAFLPFFANLIFFFNNYISKKFFAGNDFVKKIFEYVNIFIVISFTLIFIKIIFLIS